MIIKGRLSSFQGVLKDWRRRDADESQTKKRQNRSSTAHFNQKGIAESA